MWIGTELISHCYKAGMTSTIVLVLLCSLIGCYGDDPLFFRHSSGKTIEMSSNVICPDGSICPGTDTCCILVSGKYGCCGYPMAVCCPDRLNCCPNGYTCQIDRCVRGTESVPLRVKTPALPANNDICPGGQVQCPSGWTCCKSASGSYSCCPYPQAVCCPDRVNCCPNGYTCKPYGCVRGTESVPLSVKTPALPANNDICPGGQSQCPSGSTCCMSASGSYSCCPYPQAVCCSDGVHCCPFGTVCDVHAGRCLSTQLNIPWLNKAPVKLSLK